jgi:methylmalonyl-CoA mutase
VTTLEKIKFPASTSSDWAKIASQELNHEDPFGKLSRTVGGIPVKPYYDSKDVSQIDEIKSSYFSGSWLNVPKVSVHEAILANQIALSHLNAGADGILFDLRANVLAEDLLKEIELPHCHVFFLCDEGTGPAYLESFKAYVARKKWKFANGSFYARDGFYSTDVSIEKFCFGFKIQENEDSVQQLSNALRTAILQIESLTNSGVPVDKALQSLSFLWPVKNNFFLSVVEMRALRMLWALIEEAYGAKDSPLFLHAFSPAWANDNFQPHGNLIKQTISGLAAVLGNVSAITCEAENEDVSMLTRTARNISSMLKEESHLDKVIDPVAGSYFIERSSIELAEKSWKKFQETL